MTLNLCADSKVDDLLLSRTYRPMRAFYDALKANEGIELPMAIIMDRRCGIERRAEEEDVPRYFDVSYVGATPLMVAIHARRVDVAKALLAAGADPNAKTATGDNSLMEAARTGTSEAIESLMSYGADIDAVDEEGNTAFHFAANRRYAGLIELLERSGPSLEAVDGKGRTPLYYAASWRDVGSIKALLKLGACQAAADNKGWTPLHCAAQTGSIDAIEAFRYDVAAFEANLTVVDTNGRTPLQVYTSTEVYKPHSSSDDSKTCALLTPK